ncbi:hypothetical protein P4H21_18230 [Bacillus cereus]|nr:hypothetical protein [Bacillus cereus]
MSETYVIKGELIDLDAEKKEIFLSYLYKSFEKMELSCETSGKSVDYYKGETTLEDVYFMVKNDLKLQVDSSVINFVFKSFWSEEGVEYIEITSDDPSDFWIMFIKEKITEALASAFAQKMETFFFREPFYYIGNKLDGDYYIQNWMISPATPKVMEIFMEESAIYFNMSVEGINSNHARAKFETIGKEIMAILSVILSRGIYKGQHEVRWGCAKDSQTKAELIEIGFRDDQPYPTEMPKKKRERLGEFEEPSKIHLFKSINSNIKLPNNIRKLFRAYEGLSYDEKSAFLSAARMYQLALTLGRHNSTVKSSYQIAALDALSKLIRENNKNKNAIISMVEKYSPSFKGEIGKLYDSVRSAHFHQGSFSKFDVNGIELGPFKGPASFLNEEAYTIDTIAREVLIGWLTDKIPDETP